MDNESAKTTIVIDRDQAVSLLAAISDSVEKCLYFRDEPLNKLIEDFRKHPKFKDYSDEDLTDYVEELRDSAKTLLKAYGPLSEELKIAYNELSEIDEAQAMGKIVGLDKKPLN